MLSFQCHYKPISTKKIGIMSENENGNSFTEGEDVYGKYLKLAMGSQTFSAVKNSKILVVGAGGIGCELLKNLVLSGFVNLEVVDLDTIDVSNLNRQFLFRSHHVGKSKSQVARDAILKFNPKAKVIAHHGNIKTSEFGVHFFKKFNLVMNALDNLDARRHVNRLCLAADIPLIEAGSTGFLGQVTVIKKGETECYECQPKASQKVYPICTIRSTPDKPVHCIVWAKELYKLLFGPAENSMLYENMEGDEPSTYMDKVGTPASFDKSSLEKYARDIVVAVFSEEIRKQLSMDRYKTASRVPEVLNEKLVSGCDIESTRPKHSGAGWDRAYWTVEQCIAEVLGCIIDMWSDEQIRKGMGSYEFDKDDQRAMLFVTAATNLRCCTFQIPLQNLYEAKGIAGNIIPAIATTNAIIAGLQVVEAIKVLTAAEKKGSVKETCRFTYCLRNRTRKGLLLQPTKLIDPSPKCFVCNTAQLELYIDTKTATLETLVNAVLKKRLSVNEPSVSIGYNTLYEEGDGADEGLKINLPKILQELPAGGVKDGITLSIEDFSQDLTLNIIVYHREEFDEEKNPEGFLIEGSTDKPGGESNSDRGSKFKDSMNMSKEGSAAATSESKEDSDDDFLIVLDSEKVRRKRKLAESAGDEGPAAKRSQSNRSELTVSQEQNAIEIL
mmetsp:Transcript_17796/g.23061  ORF Transcript_17796/g.23061 Transcript_17796/m.23061 type:complete len:668 (-) Transcript_17796:312-2315(-)